MATNGNDINDEEEDVRRKLDAVRDQKKALLRSKSTGDELFQIRKEERVWQEKLEQIREENFQKELKQRRLVGGFCAENEAMQTELEALKVENAELKAHSSASENKLKDLQAENRSMRTKLASYEQERKQAADALVVKKEVEQLKRQSLQPTASLNRVRKTMEVVRSYSITQQKEKKKLEGQVASLEDEISVVRKISSDTQRRQLAELEPASSETSRKNQQELENDSEITTENHADVLRRVPAKVSEKIDAHSVARKMFQHNALTMNELQSIQSKRSEPVRATEQLLNIVSNQSSAVYGLFLTSLKEDQHDIYELIVGDSYTGFDEKFAHTQVIQQHYVFMVDTLSVKRSRLVDELYQSGVLTLEQTEHISSESVSFIQNEILLRVLSCKTKDHFDKFLDALDKTGQRHIRNQITGRKDQESGPVEAESVVSFEMVEQQLKQASDSVSTLLEQLQPDNQTSPSRPAQPTNKPIHDRPLTARKTASLPANESTPVTGVACLKERIFVVHRGSNSIVSFTSEEPFTREREIVVDGLEYPTDIAANADTGCLYIPDEKIHVVWRINVADGEVVQWLSGLDVFTESVASDGRLVLLVLVDEQGSEEEETHAWHGEVHVCSPDALTESVVKLSPSITSPCHAVMTKRKTFVVIYGCYPWHEVHGVCEVDMAGRILKVFASKPGNEVGQLDEPCHLSLDDRDLIMMADKGNSRVLTLSKQLVVQRPLATWNRQNAPSNADDHPCRLDYNQESRRLLVGLHSGHVDVYNIA